MLKLLLLPLILTSQLVLATEYHPVECKEVAVFMGWANSSGTINYDKFVKGYKALAHSNGFNVEDDTRKAAGRYGFKINSLKTKLAKKLITKEHYEEERYQWITNYCKDGYGDVHAVACNPFQVYCAQTISEKTIESTMQKIKRCTDKFQKGTPCSSPYNTPKKLQNNANYVKGKFKEIADFNQHMKDSAKHCDTFGSGICEETGAWTSDVIQYKAILTYYQDVKVSYDNWELKYDELEKQLADLVKDMDEEEKRKFLKDKVNEQNDLTLNKHREEAGIKEDVCDTLHSCKKYLYKNGMSNQVDELEHIEICKFSGMHEYVDQFKELEDFLNKTFWPNEEYLQLQKIATQSLNQLQKMTVMQFAQYLKSLTGETPTFEQIKSIIPEFANSSIAKKVMQDPEFTASLEKIPKFDKEKEIQEYNNFAGKINAVCAKTRSSDADTRNEAYTKLYDLLPQYDNLKISQLRFVEDIREIATPFDGDACGVEGTPGIKPIYPSEVDDFKSAINVSLMKVYKDKAKDIKEKRGYINYIDNFVYDLKPGSLARADASIKAENAFKEIIQDDPYAVHFAIQENPEISSAKWICRGLVGLHGDEVSEWWTDQIVNGVAMAGAVVATVMTGGAAAVAIGAGASALYIGNAADNYIDAREQKADLEASGAIKSKDLNAIMSELEILDAEEQAAFTDLLLSAIPFAGGALNSAIKIGKSGLSLSQYIKTMNTSINLEAKGLTGAGKLIQDALKTGNKITPKMLTKAVHSQLNKFKGVISQEQKTNLKFFQDVLKRGSKDTAIELMTHASVQENPPGIFTDEGMSKFLQSRAVTGVTKGSAGYSFARLKGHIETKRLQQYLPVSGTVYQKSGNPSGRIIKTIKSNLEDDEEEKDEGL